MSIELDCPGDGTCSNRGTCDDSVGNCICNPGFEGDTCQGIVISNWYIRLIYMILHFKTYHVLEETVLVLETDNVISQQESVLVLQDIMELTVQVNFLQRFISQ